MYPGDPGSAELKFKRETGTQSEYFVLPCKEAVGGGASRVRE